MFPTTPLSPFLSFLSRPAAAVLLLAGWLLRIGGVLLGIAVWVGGTWFAATTEDFGGTWWWAIIELPIWGFVGVMTGYPVFGIGHFMVEYGDNLTRRGRPPMA